MMNYRTSRTWASLIALATALWLAGCAGTHPPRSDSELMADMGDLRPSAKPAAANEDVPIGEKEGLQVRKEGLFMNVKRGVHRDRETKYLWTIDDRGLCIALEQTPFETSRGHITHTNLSKLAHFAGEAWFTGAREVTVNGRSGRFGDRAHGTEKQYEAAVEYWEKLGYRVEVIPLGKK